MHLLTFQHFIISMLLTVQLEMGWGRSSCMDYVLSRTKGLSNMEGKSKKIETELDFYCDINVNCVCRICLEKCPAQKQMFDIFEPKIPVHLCNMIMTCASVQIMEGDGLPNMICTKCMTKLNVAWQFKKLCENSDSKLRHYYTNTQLQLTTGADDFNLIIKQQQYKKNLDCNNLQSSCSIQLSSEDKDCSVDESGDDDITNNAKSFLRQSSDNNREQKIHQCDTCGKTFNRREYLTQHIRIHTGEKPYCCHLCNKRFVNSGHLTTHMRTHTGEKPHICSLCPKAFSTRQELQKHTMVHNGERPFICKMCGKRFGSSSNLYSHVKHHTGEKNFTCEHCGKAFYTKQELKQHLVVHTGEKAYLCEFCNKRFSQVAHLRRHSKIHKNSIE